MWDAGKKMRGTLTRWQAAKLAWRRQLGGVLILFAVAGTHIS